MVSVVVKKPEQAVCLNQLSSISYLAGNFHSLPVYWQDFQLLDTFQRSNSRNSHCTWKMYFKFSISKCPLIFLDNLFIGTWSFFKMHSNNWHFPRRASTTDADAILFSSQFTALGIWMACEGVRSFSLWKKKR